MYVCMRDLIIEDVTYRKECWNVLVGYGVDSCPDFLRRYGLDVESGYDAKIRAAALESPEEIWVAGL